MAENASRVSLISFIVCEAVGINLNKINPLGITSSNFAITIPFKNSNIVNKHLPSSVVSHIIGCISTAKESGAFVFGICNVVGSSIARAIFRDEQCNSRL